ncbi:MAG: peptide ABC transporter permease [Sphingomonas sp.]|nr:MAG: peptide ABC transporter permease [Sphingomonas sp.]
MNNILLNNVEHADLRVAIRPGAEFGDSVNQLPIYPSEFEEAQRSFPIVFRREEGGIEAYVLLGLDRDENLFLEDGRWTSDYVPAVQRRGPFSVGIGRSASDDAGGSEGDPLVYIDRDDPRVGADDGLPLFLEHGGNAPLLDHIASVLRVLHEGVATAPAIYAELEAAGLLQPVDIQISLSEEEGYELPDLLTVDQSALAALSGEQLETLHRSGLLRAATMAASSLGNIQYLIDRKNRKRLPA